MGESRERSRASYPSGRSPVRYEEEEEDDRRGGFPWVMAVSVAAILLFIVAVFFFLYRTFFSGIFAPPKTYTVPNLEGKSYEEVLQDTQLLQDHFTVVLGETVADSAEAGVILKQDPVADSSVGDSTTEITVTVSGGPQVVQMPNLYNMEWRQAYLEIEKFSLKAATPSYEYHDTVAKNHVISFTPLEGTPLAPGTEVQLVVSLGPEIKKVQLISLVDMTQEDAKSKITLLNLQIGAVTKVFSDTVSAGRVVSHYPAPGSEVDEGTKVNLEISKGPDPAKQPKEVTLTVEVPLPNSGFMINVQVMMDGAVIYQENVEAGKSSVRFAVTASGTKTLFIYLDGVLTDQIEKEFK